MQAEYYPFNQGPPVMMPPQMAAAAAAAAAAQQFTYGGYIPYGYPIGQTLPTHKNVEKLRRNKKSSSSNNNNNNASSDSRKFEEITNSTDESIHLVRSRKTGESAPTRYDGQESQKKRSQSGNSLVKDAQQQEEALLAAQQQRHRSQSDERSISPNNSASNQSRNASNNHISSDSASQKGKSKRRKDRKHRKNGSQWHYNETENRLIEQYYVPSSPYNVLPMQYGGQCCTPTNYPYQSGGQDGASSWGGNDYNVSIQAQQQQAASSYIQQQQQQQQQQQSQQEYYGNNSWQPQQSGYDVAPGAPMPITIECTQYPQGCVPQQQYDPCCYQQQQAPQQQQPPYYPPECYPQENGYSQPSNSYQCFELPQQPGLPPGAKIVAEYFLGYLDDQQTQQYCQQYPYPPPQTSSESSKEDVEVERWEKPKKQDSFSEYEDDRRACKDDDLKRLKDDIIKTIQNELGNLKLDVKSDPIQPIFLMPKSSEQSQQKPIYIPRNIYVPVIRPVFVPRERIIVRPQIIHVARPVLVDRPVPIQQRPIVIERDRPVPVRVETIEKTEPIIGSGNCNELTRNIETGQEVTYHEFTQTYPNAQGEYTTSSYQYNDQLDYDENRRKAQQHAQQQQSQQQQQQQQQPHDVMSLLEEAERRKNTLSSKSNEDIYGSKYGGQSKTLESVLGNSTGYTLEVLDQRISDKFEKTDQETIKQRYGVDSYQYLPPTSSEQQQQQQQTSTGASISNNANNRQQVSSSEFYTNQTLGHSGSYKSLASVNNETRISNSNIYGSYGNANESTGLVYGTSSINQTSPRTSINQQQNILKSYGSYSNDQPLSENC